MSDQPGVVIPSYCDRHLRDLVVEQLRMPPEDTWRAAVIISQILFSQWVFADPRIFARTDGKLENMTLVLAEIGCLACYDPGGYRRVVGLMLKDGRKGPDRWKTAVAVSKRELTHPDWPIEAHADGKL